MNIKPASEKITVTKFINIMGGEELVYDACMSEEFMNENRQAFNGMAEEYIYMGKGFISSVDGKPYNGSVLCHFWKNK